MWQSWVIIVLDDVVSYSVEAGESGVSVGCVLRFAADQRLTRDDVLVSRVEQLDTSLTLGVSEELLSNVINITVVSHVAQVCFTTTTAHVTSRQFTANDASCFVSSFTNVLKAAYPTNHSR